MKKLSQFSQEQINSIIEKHYPSYKDMILEALSEEIEISSFCMKHNVSETFLEDMIENLEVKLNRQERAAKSLIEQNDVNKNSISPESMGVKVPSVHIEDKEQGAPELIKVSPIDKLRSQIDKSTTMEISINCSYSLMMC